MADTNWIKVNRSILNHWIWLEQPFSKGQAWIDLLLTANYMDKKIPFDGKLITVKRGSFVTSIYKLAERWDWNRKTVKSFLDILKSDGMIDYECTSRCTTITIVNYEVFQCYGATDGTTKGLAEDYSGTTDGLVEDYSGTQHKKVKKEKKEKESKEIKNKVFVPDEALNETILSYIDYRKGIKKPMTDRAVELLIKKLDGMAADNDTKMAILNQSIVNGWQGIFPLKNDSKGFSQGNQGFSQGSGRLDWIDDI